MNEINANVGFINNVVVVEDERMAIDLKVDCLKKLKAIPLDVVGTYSFMVNGFCQFRKDDKMNLPQV